MGLFSTKKSTTNLSTTNIFTDQSANAAEGGIAVGAGASVNIESVDKEIAKAAFDSNLGATKAAQETAALALVTNQNTSLGALAANQNVTVAALGSGERTAQLSIAAQNQLAGLALNKTGELAGKTVELAGKSVDSAERLAKFTGSTLAGFAGVSSRERQDVLRQTETALRSSEGAAGKFASLASAALERSQTPDSAVTKTLLYVVGAVAALVVLFLLGGRRRAT